MASPPVAYEVDKSGHDKEQLSGVWERDTDLDARVAMAQNREKKRRGWPMLLLAWSSLGVIYGDIGTSPLYTLGTLFADGAPDDEQEIMGTFSMIFWYLTIIVLIKYVTFALRADDNGEGGTFALYAIISRACNLRSGGATHTSDFELSGYDPLASATAPQGSDAAPAPNANVKVKSGANARVKRALATSSFLQVLLLSITLSAVCLILSDGVLTPAISVVSAAQGIQYQSHISNDAVVGISIGIIFIIFSVQQFGTKKISYLFAPVTTIWFLAIAAVGLYNIFKFRPAVFAAISPHYLYYYWKAGAHEAWVKLGGVTLALTGAEALFADLGHFNAPAIRTSFIAFVYPSLVCAYLGQTAFIIHDRSAAPTAFWSSVPKPIYWPMVVIATLAAVLASQAMITGCFSIVQQAVALNCFPRVTIRHTEATHRGQIYAPQVNWVLMAGTVIVIGIFQTGPGIGAAYGLAVVSTFFLTTSLLSLVMLVAWEWNWGWVLLFWLPLSTLEGMLLSANALKVPDGAWFSLGVTAILVTILATWTYGQKLKRGYQDQHRSYLLDLLQPADGPGAGPTPALQLAGSRQRLGVAPGIGLYYTESLAGVPPVLAFLLPRIPAIHEVTVFLTVRHVPLPTVHASERLLLRKLHYQGFYHAVVRYGYMEAVDHDKQFVDTLVQELLDFLSPEVIKESEAAAADEGSPSDVTLGSATGRARRSLAAAAKAIAAAHRAATALKAVDEDASTKQAGKELVGQDGKDTPGLALHVEEREGAPSPWVQQPSQFRASLRKRHGASLSTDTFPTNAPAQSERALVGAAAGHGTRFILGNTHLTPGTDCGWIKAFVVETMYGVLSRNIQSTAQTYRLDPDAAVEVGINMRV
ncbi:KUP1 [Auxenochlorella protothecoides x Auxenochlorella symbiontica]